MIGGATCRFQHDPLERQPQIQFVDEDVDHLHRIVSTYVVVEELGQQNALPTVLRSAANPSRAASTKRAWGASFLLFAPFVLSGEILKPLPIGRNCRSYRRSAFRASMLRRGISGSAIRRKRTLASRTITTASSPSLRFWQEPIVVNRFVQSNESGVSAPRLGAT
jgi:hypothetical protein